MIFWGNRGFKVNSDGRILPIHCLMFKKQRIYVDCFGQEVLVIPSKEQTLKYKFLVCYITRQLSTRQTDPVHSYFVKMSKFKSYPHNAAP